MRSKMNWLYIVFCLLAVALATQMASASGVLNDPGEPGSVLVFPLFETGITPGGETPILRAVSEPPTQLEISVVCPKGAVCADQQEVVLKLHWVCFDQDSPLCSETDFTLSTTVNGTIRFDPQGNCEPPQNLGTNPFETCGFVPPPPCYTGYLIAWVIDENTGGSIKFDGLIGDAVLRENYTAVTAYNAIPIQAGGALATGASTNLSYGGKPPTGHLNFNGVAYKELTNTIIGSIHYDGTDPVGGITTETALVLLTLDTKSNQLNNPITVNFNFYNEIEQVISESNTFFCADQVYLYDLNLPDGGSSQNPFGIKGLVESTSAVKMPFFGVSDHTGPVTLLGLVITREDSDTRHYAYPLFDNSTPLVTAFAP